MLSCKDISQLTSDLLDKKLSFPMRMKIKIHLLICHKCRDFVKQMSIVVNTVKRLKPEEPQEKAINQQVETLMAANKQNSSNNHK